MIQSGFYLRILFYLIHFWNRYILFTIFEFPIKAVKQSMEQYNPLTKIVAIGLSYNRGCWWRYWWDVCCKEASIFTSIIVMLIEGGNRRHLEMIFKEIVKNMTLKIFPFLNLRKLLRAQLTTLSWPSKSFFSVIYNGK